MTIEKLRNHEPLFGSWYVDVKLAEGRNSKIFKVYKTVNGVPTFLALKTMKFPSSDRELSRVIESGKYRTVDEYLDMLEETVTQNMNKMLSLRTNPHIVRYDNFKIVREKSCFYVIMLIELLCPFSEYIQPDSITASQAAKIGSDLCSAIEGFRNAGIIHHQIKPENIYVDQDGTFKLGDFGISNVSERIKTEASPYMAPEIYNELSYDTASDIYSVGVLLYKLLNNNRLPFLPAFPNPVSLSDRETAFERQIRGETPPPPAEADAEMSRIIFTALSYNQADRYFSPILMKTELNRYIEYAPSDPIGAEEEESIPASDYAPLSSEGYSIADENDINLSSYQEPVPININTSINEQAAFMEAFNDEEDNDDTDNKKLYLIIGGIIALIGIVSAILFFGLSKKNDTNNPTVPSTAPPTVATTPAPTIPTTEPLTVPTTEPTTETTTTEPTTTEPTTTQPTTVPTTQPTTEPTTVPTTQEFTGTPILVVTNHEDGETSPDGKIYTEITDYTIIQTPDDDYFDEVVIDITTPLGENIENNGKVFIYEMAGATILQKVEANLSCIMTEDNGDLSTSCFITVNDSEFYYAPDYYQYYVCFEEGAIVSDTVISLPLQIEI